MNDFLVAIFYMALFGLVAGVLIAISAKVFYVKPDERIQKIFELLPHYNCGACGTPGCEAMAAELVEGNIKVEKCRPAKPEQIEKIKLAMSEMELG